MKEKTSQQYIYLSYFLVLIGYMTLTISAPLSTYISSSLHLSTEQIQVGISILFFMFSLSAISLSRIADFIGAYQVLRYVQLISIGGLIVIALCHSRSMLYFGFFLIGAGTGCYSSIARLIISKETRDQLQMRHAFANFSMLLVTGPVVSSYIALLCSHINWRLAYLVMAIIEVVLLSFVFVLLRHAPIVKRVITVKAILQGYWLCLIKPYYTINMLFVGICLAIFINLLLGNAHQLLQQLYGVTPSTYSLITLVMTFAYIFGIILLRLLLHKIVEEKARIVCVAALTIGVIWYAFSFHFANHLAAIYLSSIAIGFLVPLSTSCGMLVIHDHHGAAAALYPSSFALIAGIFSLVASHWRWGINAYISSMLILCAIVLVILTLLVQSAKKSVSSHN